MSKEKEEGMKLRIILWVRLTEQVAKYERSSKQLIIWMKQNILVVVYFFGGYC